MVPIKSSEFCLEKKIKKVAELPEIKRKRIIDTLYYVYK